MQSFDSVNCLGARTNWTQALFEQSSSVHGVGHTVSTGFSWMCYTNDISPDNETLQWPYINAYVWGFVEGFWSVSSSPTKYSSEELSLSTLATYLLRVKPEACMQAWPYVFLHRPLGEDCEWGACHYQAVPFTDACQYEVVTVSTLPPCLSRHTMTHNSVIWWT